MDFFEIFKEWLPTLTGVLGSIGAVLAGIKSITKKISVKDVESEIIRLKTEIVVLKKQLLVSESKNDEILKIIKKVERRQRGVDDDVRKN